MWLPGDGRAGGLDYEGNVETFWGDGYTHYLDYGDGLMNISVKSHQIYSLIVSFIVIAIPYKTEKKKQKSTEIILHPSLSLQHSTVSTFPW